MDDVLVDTSYLIALGFPRDKYHKQAKDFAKTAKLKLLVPDLVLVEAMYVFAHLGGVDAKIQFADNLLKNHTPLLSLNTSDHTRAVEIMRKFRDSNLDYVDCCITALAERRNITHICTFDRRDFGIIRPNHAPYFVLLPTTP